MQILEKIKRRNRDPFGSMPVTIVCVGDSVTHGCFESMLNLHGKIDTRYSPEESYVRRLQDELYRLYPTAAVNVLNCGIGGDNASGVLNRFDRDIARYMPDLVVYCLGLNDSMASDEENGCARYVQAMEGLFAQTLAQEAECIYLTPNMMCTYVDPSLPEGALTEVAATAARRQNDGILTHYVQAAAKLAREMGVPVADAYGEWMTYASNEVDVTALLANRINHPIPRMHALFARKLCEAIFAGAAER